MTVCVFDPQKLEMVADKVTVAGGLYSGQQKKITQFCKENVIYTLGMSGTCWLIEHIRDMFAKELDQKGLLEDIDWLSMHLELIELLKKVGEIDEDPNVFDGLLVVHDQLKETTRVFKLNNSLIPFEYDDNSGELLTVGTPDMCLAVQLATAIMREFAENNRTSPYSVPYIMSQLYKFHSAAKLTDIDIVDVTEYDGAFAYVR